METPEQLLSRREIAKKMTTLQMYQVQGNFHDDEGAFEMANEIIYSAYQQGLNFMALRALAEIDRIMGNDETQAVTMDDLRCYVKEAGWH